MESIHQQAQEQAAPVVWHRFEAIKYASASYTIHGDFEYGEGRVEVEHRAYKVLRTTPKGVWLDVGFQPKFVRRDAHRQFASPTIELAKEKFIRRKQRHLSILRKQAADVQKALELVDEAAKRATAKILAEASKEAASATSGHGAHEAGACETLC